MKQIDLALKGIETRTVETPSPGAERALAQRSNANRVLTSSTTAEWYTPPEIVNRVRQVFGDSVDRANIDLDPCGSSESQAIIQARAFYADAGLSLEWDLQLPTTVFVNPPYAGETAAWVHKAASTRFSLVILLVNNHTHRKWFTEIWNAPAICFPFRPLRFLTPRASVLDGAKGYENVPEYPGLLRGTQPTHGSVLAAFAGSQINARTASRFFHAFGERFSDIGKIIRAEDAVERQP